MNEGLSVLIGMSIAYVASFLGLVLAFVSYRRHQKERGAGAKRDKDA